MSSPVEGPPSTVQPVVTVPGTAGRRAAGLLLLISCLVLALLVGRSGGIEVGRWHLFILVALWTTGGTGACLLLAAAPRRSDGALVLAVALALQVIALLAGPALSDDLYRYVWDGRVAAAGLDPYAAPPDSPQLTRLHEPFLWPSLTGCTTRRSELPRSARADPFAGDGKLPGCTTINRPEVRTIYPPAAQLAFRAGYAVTPWSARELQAELPAAVYSLALTGLLVVLLRRAGRPAAWALLYAATPLAALEAGMDGHIDVLAALLGVAAVAVLGRSNVRAGAAAAAGVLVALATLVKLYPAALAAAALPRLGHSPRRTGAFVAAGLLTAAALYAPHIAAVGTQVVGYLPGYLTENGYASGDRFALVGLLGLSGTGASVTVAVLLLALVLASVLRPLYGDVTAVAGRVVLVVGGAFLLVTPGNAWYCALLMACAALARRPEWILVLVANYTTYFDAVLVEQSVWPKVSYAAAAAGIGLTAVLRHRWAARVPR
jgi:hypothetical protein